MWLVQGLCLVQNLKPSTADTNLFAKFSPSHTLRLSIVSWQGPVTSSVSLTRGKVNLNVPKPCLGALICRHCVPVPHILLEPGVELRKLA